jgi:hypothetical protein
VVVKTRDVQVIDSQQLKLRWKQVEQLVRRRARCYRCAVRWLLVLALIGCDGTHAAGLDAAIRSDATRDAQGFVPAPHLGWPTIPNHGGHELSPLRVVTVIAADEPYASQLQAFGDALVHSGWLASYASEYGIASTGSHRVVTGPHVATGTSFSQAKMNQYIASAIAAAPSPPLADGHTVYVMYLPPGTVLDNNGVPDTACALVPYHTGYGSLGDGMAVLNRCPAGFASQLEMFEIVAAHEIAEAATDANPVGNPAWQLWLAPATAPYRASLWLQEEIYSSVEIGDLCIATRSTENGMEYQREFSNAAAATGLDPCVPALGVPFFNVSPDPSTKGWFAATAGQQVSIEVTGWSSAPTQDWIATADPHASDGSPFPAHLESPTSTTIGGRTYRTTNNARALMVKATIPPSATSGWWGVVKIWSFHVDAAGSTPGDEDIAHEGLVGLYVP